MADKNIRIRRCYLFPTSGWRCELCSLPSSYSRVFTNHGLVPLLGSGILATSKNSPSASDTGNNVIIGGLVLQLLWFGLFVVVAAVFHYRMRSIPTVRSQQPECRWQIYLQTLYVSGCLIIIRNLFRVIEYAQGNDGYLLTKEAFIYIFDALPMLIVVAWLHWRHPGEIGLLLRGEKGIKNGFQLINVGSKSSA